MQALLARHRDLCLALSLAVLYLLVAVFWQNLQFNDESNYLDAGSHLHASLFLYDLPSAPGYALWYRLLTYICPEPVSRFFLSWALLVALVALLPAMLRVRYAWLFTLVLVAVPYFNVGPYVSLFAAAFVTAGMCFVLQRGLSLFSALSLSCAVCFVLAFCRPEFAYGVFFSACGAVTAFALGRSRGPRSTAFAMLASTACLVCLTLFILKHTDSSRSGMAFAQHVNIRAAQRGVLGGADPWISSYAQKAFHVDTDHNAADIHATIGDFFRANPRLFLRQVLANSTDPRSLVLILAMTTVAAWQWRSKSSPLREASWFLLCTSLPVLLSFLVIYPEAHYATIILPAYLLLSLQAIRPRAWLLRPPLGFVLPLGFAGMFVCNIVGRLALRHPLPNRSGIETIGCLRELGEARREDTATMFDPMGIPNIYLQQPTVQTSLSELDDWHAFQAWAARTKPSWVLVTPAVARQYRVTPVQVDTYLRQELAYSAHPCPSTTSLTVYVSPQP